MLFKSLFTRFVFGSFVVVFGVAQFAAAEVTNRETALPSCKEAWLNPKSVQIGYTCAVETGDAYTRVEREGFGIAWKDLETGLIWSEQQNINGHRFAHFDDAWDHCDALKAHLPLPEDCVEARTHVSYYPMSWRNLFTFYTSKLDEFNGNTIELLARTCSGLHPEYANSRNSSGNYGGQDRRYASDVYTVCVDDSEAVNQRVRPLKPAPVEHNEP